MVDNPPEILTITEAALYLRISLSSLYKLAQEGKFPPKRWVNIGVYKQTLTDWIAVGNMNFQEHKSTPKAWISHEPRR